MSSKNVNQTTIWKAIYRSILVLAICTVMFLSGPVYLYWRSTKGELLSVQNASDDILAISYQTFVTILFPIVLFVLFVFLLKKEFPSRMYFNLKGKWQRISVAILCFAILGITIYCLITKTDNLTILFNLVYYVVAVAFVEEFVVRDVCTDLLRSYTWPIRYLVPNICFAFMHIFSYAHFQPITGSFLLHFVTSGINGLVFMGCVFQLLKEKSGTIWIPILLHALMDFSYVLKY